MVLRLDSEGEIAMAQDDTAADVPRFQQIAALLRSRIRRGEMAAHDGLPSERAIADSHDVSRMTARRALEALEAEGLIYSEDRRGRFVSPRRLRYDVSRMVSFLAEAGGGADELEIDVLDKGQTGAGPRAVECLGLEPGEPLFSYTRVFRSQGHAVFMETEHVVAARFPGFLEYDLHQSTTRLLERRYNARACRGDITIRMRGATGRESETLGLPSNSAIIELEQVILDETGHAFCLGQQVWRGELAEFAVRAEVSPGDAR